MNSDTSLSILQIEHRFTKHFYTASVVEKVAERVARRYLDEQIALRVASRFAGKQDRIIVRNRKTKKVVQVKPETLKERPGDFEIIRKEEGRNPGGKPDYHKDKLPEPPKYPKRPLPDPMPRRKKPPRPKKPLKIPEPPEPKKRKPLPGQKGWKPSQR